MLAAQANGEALPWLYIQSVVKVTSSCSSLHAAVAITEKTVKQREAGPVNHFIFITTFYHPHYLFSGAFLFCLWSNNCSSSSFLSVCCYNYRLNCVFRRHQWTAESWIRRQLVSSCCVCKLLLPGGPCFLHARYPDIAVMYSTQKLL